jgi:membrane protein implicated in regulation of membrane protease activity
VLLGLALLGIELFTPGGFFLVFFGAAALVVGGLRATALGAALGSSLAAQVLLFTGLAVAGIALFRRALVARFGRAAALDASAVDSLLGARAVALGTLLPGGPGTVELRGTSWSARNSGSIALGRGQHCTVERVEGLTLWVRVAAEEYLAETRPKETLT